MATGCASLSPITCGAARTTTGPSAATFGFLAELSCVGHDDSVQDEPCEHGEPVPDAYDPLISTPPVFTRSWRIACMAPLRIARRGKPSITVGKTCSTPGAPAAGLPPHADRSSRGLPAIPPQRYNGTNGDRLTMATEKKSRTAWAIA